VVDPARLDHLAPPSAGAIFARPDNRMSQRTRGLKRDCASRDRANRQGNSLITRNEFLLRSRIGELHEIIDIQQPSSATDVLDRVTRPEDAMSLLAMTTAVLLVASSGSSGTTSLGTNPSTDAARIATNAGFLLGNAHRCGIATDRVVKAGQTIRELIHAAAKDTQEQDDATEQFATYFLATALPDQNDSKLVASCNAVTSEFQKLERHRVAGTASNKATGGTTTPAYRLSDGE